MHWLVGLYHVLRGQLVGTCSCNAISAAEFPLQLFLTGGSNSFTSPLLSGHQLSGSLWECMSLIFSLPSLNLSEIGRGLKRVGRKRWRSVWQTDNTIFGFTRNQAKMWGCANDNKEADFIVQNLSMIKK